MEGKARLVEPIVRQRILDLLFYKQHLHTANEAALLAVAAHEVHFVAGTDAMGRPSPFLCCLLRMLELEPAADIVRLFLEQNGYAEFKYVTALALVYCRMAWSSADFFKVHDEYIADYRRLRRMLHSPRFEEGIPRHYDVFCVDELADELAEKGRVVDLAMPHLTPRLVLIGRNEAAPRVYGCDVLEPESEHDSDSD